MAATTETITITSDHLKALRNADTLVFYYNEDGTAVDAIKSINPNDGFGDRDLRVRVPLFGTVITNFTGQGYVEGDRTERREVVSASWVVQSAKYNGEAFTLVRHILRAGDRVQVHFMVSNDNGNLRKANLTQDELRIEISRGPIDQPDKCKTLVLLLDTSIYSPYSPARNIRFA